MSEESTFSPEEHPDLRALDTEEEMLDALSEEFAETLYNVPILKDDETGEYYQVVNGEEGEDVVKIDPKYYPVVKRYL